MSHPVGKVKAKLPVTYNVITFVSLEPGAFVSLKVVASDIVKSQVSASDQSTFKVPELGVAEESLSLSPTKAKVPALSGIKALWLLVASEVIEW